MPRKDPAAYRAYMREYMLRRYHRRRAEWIERLGGKCAECGKETALEFDHVDATVKAEAIARILTSGSARRVREEMAKCQLLCGRCHRAKTKRER